MDRWELEVSTHKARQLFSSTFCLMSAGVSLLQPVFGEYSTKTKAVADSFRHLIEAAKFIDQDVKALLHLILWLLSGEPVREIATLAWNRL